MKNFIKHIFCLAVSVSGAASAANWQPLGNTANEAFYVDPGEIVVVNGMRKAWQMIDVLPGKKPNMWAGKTYKSEVELQFVDCQARTMAIGQRIRYQGQMGSGDTVSTQSVQLYQLQPFDPPPDSAGRVFIEYVCRQPLSQR